MGLREVGLNPRAIGSNPRALGINPRALGITPRENKRQLSLVDDGWMPPTTAQHLVGELVELCRDSGLPLDRRTIGQLAKQTKELLEDGFTEQTLRQGLVLAIETNEPHRLARICHDVNLAMLGARVDRRDYHKRLQDEAELRRP